MANLALIAVIQASILAAPAQKFPEAYRRSLDTGKPLVILVGASWCGPCMVMKNSVLPDVTKAGGLKGVEFAYVDVDLQPELAGKLSSGGAIPQLLRYEKKKAGWTGRKLTGALNAKQVTSFVKASSANAVKPGTAATTLADPATLAHQESVK